jgi:hypothetical protein
MKLKFKLAVGKNPILSQSQQEKEIVKKKKIIKYIKII